ncbi:putative ubiquinone biosynthesis monooxygenase, partial [Coemansia sp. RSA 2706]
SRTTFPLRMRIVDSLTADRTALVGDAGHVMHPLAGQGLNMGLADVQCLAQVLEQAAAAGEDLGATAVLDRYNRQRYVRNLAMQGVVDKVWHVFGARSKAVVADEGASREEQLLAACMSDQSDMVKEILADPKRVNINHTNGVGFTALHYAAQTRSLDCIRLLTKYKGIDANIQDRMSGNTPLHLVLIHGEEEDPMLDIVELLLKAGANPNIANKEHERPIQLTHDDEDDIQRMLVRASVAIEAKHAQAAFDDQDDDDDDDSD